MRIGELAQRSGVSRDTLRFYERQGLIRSAPGQAASNSYRDYPETTLPALDWIAEARAAGLSLGDLVQLLDQLDTADPEDFDGEAFLQTKIIEVEDRIRRARRFLTTLKRAKAALAKPV